MKVRTITIPTPTEHRHHHNKKARLNGPVSLRTEEWYIDLDQPG
jgi:hypothetical protein